MKYPAEYIRRIFLLTNPQSRKHSGSNLWGLKIFLVLYATDVAFFASFSFRNVAIIDGEIDRDEIGIF